MGNKLLLVFMLLLTGLSSWGQSLNIGGHRAVQDSRDSIWLCSVPQSFFGNNYTAVITYDDTMTEFAIDGTPVASGSTVTFVGIEGGKNYTVTAHVDTADITGDITFTWLPVVELNGEFGKNYQYGTVTVNEPDSAFAEPLTARLKWRGSTTNGNSKHKRNYRIKFVNPEDSTKENHRFFGLRNDNCWILDAGQSDFLRVRNRVSTDLWLDMSRRPWYTDTLPNAHNGSRGQIVEVILNGEYVGIYNMCEPIDRKQLKLKRYDEENGVFHGGLWSAYVWSRTTTMSDPEGKPSVFDRQWSYSFEVKYPDFDEIHRANWDALYKAVMFAKRVSDSESNSRQLTVDSLGYYFDVPVMQDYYIFIATIQALDNESANIYYSTYDTQGDQRLTMTPWDLDACLGQSYTPYSNNSPSLRPERDMDWISNVPMYSMWDVKALRDPTVDRYWELRKTVLNTDNLVNRYRTVINELENSGAAAREEQRWSWDLDLANKKLDLSAEMDKVEDWIRRRMPYLDENVFIYRDDDVLPPPPPQPYPKGDVNGDYEVNIADVNALIEIILGGVDQSEGRSDVNEDGEVNISDINSVIDIIFNQ